MLRRIGKVIAVIVGAVLVLVFVVPSALAGIAWGLVSGSFKLTANASQEALVSTVLTALTKIKV